MTTTQASEAIVREIQHVDPLDGDWDTIGSLVDRLMRSDHPERGLDALLGLFERGAGIETGGGVFSDILHALEHLDGYEESLVQSIRRRPAVFTVRMARRLLNSGVSQVGGVLLASLLVDAANEPSTPQIVRSEIRGTLQDQAPSMLSRLKDF